MDRYGIEQSIGVKKYMYIKDCGNLRRCGSDDLGYVYILDRWIDRVVYVCWRGGRWKRSFSDSDSALGIWE